MSEKIAQSYNMLYNQAMDSINISDHMRRVIKIVGLFLAAYLYLTFFRLDNTLQSFFIDTVKTIIGLIFRGDYTRWISSQIIITFSDFLCLLPIGFFTWAFFFSQFVLPTHSLEERAKVLPRMLTMMGTKGPALSIRNGRLIGRPGELDRKGAGIILADSASAAVLHDKGKFTRAIGPGLTFTNKNEFIANTIDLHTQIRKLGPKDDDDVFEIKEKTEEPENEEQLEKKKIIRERRMQTSGLTRDGIEVVPNITAIFKLDSGEEKKDAPPRFRYLKESVTKAIRGESIAPDTISEEKPRTINWDWLPAHLAADLWREYLRKFTINELFEIPERPIDDTLKDKDAAGKTAYQIIVEMINERLTNPYARQLNDYGEEIEHQKESSREYKLLQSNGIKLVVAKVENLRVKDEDQFIKRWEATWLKRANEEKRNIKKHQTVVRERAQQEMYLEYSDAITIPLFQRIKKYEADEIDELPDGAESLKKLLRAMRTSIIKDPNLIHLFAGERSNLDAVIQWLQDYQKMKNGNAVPVQKIISNEETENIRQGREKKDDDTAPAGVSPLPKEE